LNKFDQNETKFTYKALVEAWEKNSRFFTIFSKLYLYFPESFQVWKIAGQISRLFSKIQDSVQTL